MIAILNEPRRSARKAKGDGHLRRAEILAAAERIFVAHGYEAATIRKIADEVGVSSTALYMHFRDKDQILLEICTGVVEELLASNRQISAMPIDAAARVRLMLEAYITFALQHPNAYQLVFCASPAATEISRQHATMQLGTECLDRFASVVRQLAAEGRLRGDPVSAHQVLWAACHGLVTLMITKPDLEWAPPEELARVMLDGLFHGLIAD
ncbi:MAG TPA: TetR/AcrR family transcriptional regulator [Caulobacteraceae bacterium]|nr:TetR/AcrR family transcriptional regulator [Caulobacteraceae bacterium]